MTKKIKRAYIQAKNVCSKAQRYLYLEREIKKSPKYSFLYSRYVIKSAFPEGEETIRKSKKWKAEYEATLTSEEKEQYINRWED